MRGIEKLDEPKNEVKIIKNKKVIYFADAFWNLHCDTQEEEFEHMAGGELRRAGIQFEKVHCVEIPPFSSTYDILFFDWGGMSMGNDMLGSFCRQIVREAELYPQRLYCMVSTFTSQAMTDAINHLDPKPENILLTVGHLISRYKVHGF